MGSGCTELTCPAHGERNRARHATELAWEAQGAFEAEVQRLREGIEALAEEWSSLAGLLRRNQSMQSDIESVALSQRATELRALLGDPDA